uniref:ACT domain-containing protein n=1 Tax=Proboscia inermis TaxID=420281 RepID=A0A7S0GHT8_9STRA|mmetsp:Transcript_37999/g.38349  ORF Transcript_37999/g.38349 Transcript_37999/m.38349 type:complete len:214 (+) Transcript_37999:55-696(+)
MFSTFAASASRRVVSNWTKQKVSSVRQFSSQQFFIVNSVGLDRSGIVSDMTGVMDKAGCNIGESRAVKLGNHFSVMMLVSAPKEETTSSLTEQLKVIDGLTITTFETSDPKAIEVNPQTGWSGQFKLSGADNPGIVYKVTSVLSKNRLSIESLLTTSEDAPFGGTKLFKMEGVATVSKPLPKSFNIVSVQEELSALGDNLNCDIELSPSDDIS